MIQIQVETDLSRVLQRFNHLSEKSISFAAARSLTATVQHAQAQMKRTISDPNGPIEGGATRWTIGALQAQWAKPSRLVAEVGFRSDTPRAAGRYLQPIIQGGRPVPKAIDRRLSRGRGGALVPNPSMVDRRGNVPYGRLGKLLASADEAGSGVFTLKLKKGGIGVFQRTRTQLGRTSTIESKLTMLGMVDASPTPRGKTFPVHQLLRKSAAEHFPGHYRASIEVELRRAGFT